MRSTVLAGMAVLLSGIFWPAPAQPDGSRTENNDRTANRPVTSPQRDRSLLSIPRTSIPAPQTPKEKFQQYLRDTYGPVAHVGTLLGAGWDQVRDHPEEWDGIQGFGQRLGSRALRFTARSTIRMSLDIAMKLDSHYRRCDCDGFWSRTGHAASSTFVARKDHGGRTIAVPRIAAAYSTSFLQNLWYPDSRNSTGDALVRGSFNLIYDAGRNVLKEFWPDIKRRLRR